MMRVIARNANLWTVERGVFLIDMPLARRTFLNHTLELLLCSVPNLQVTHPFLRVSRGHADSEIETEWLVDSLKEVESAVHLSLDLISRAENVG